MIQPFCLGMPHFVDLNNYLLGSSLQEFGKLFNFMDRTLVVAVIWSSVHHLAISHKGETFEHVCQGQTQSKLLDFCVLILVFDGISIGKIRGS